MKAFCDGSGNSPRGSTSAAILVDDEGIVVAESSKFLGYEISNNIAEYEGVIDALNLAIERGIYEIEIFSDSQLIVNQINEKFRVNQPELMELRERVWNLAVDFDSVAISWIPREQNKRADKLCRIELDAHSLDPREKRKAEMRKRVSSFSKAS